MVKSKSGEVSSRKKGVTLQQGYAHTTLRLLRLYRDTNKTQSELARYLSWSRFKVHYHAQKLLTDNMITRIKGTQFFKCTVQGVSFLDGYESNQQKSMRAIENARWKCKIRNDKLLQKFLFDNNFQHHSMENWDQWIGKIDGFTIWINFAKETSMVISHPTMYGGDFLDQYKQAESRILIILSNLNKKWNFNLTIPEPVIGKQFTIADPFADQLMKKTGGSQVKIGKRISFDQSYHTEPRTEFSELSEAIQWTTMPKLTFKHEENWEQMKTNFVALTKLVAIIDDKLTVLMKGFTEKPVEPKIKDLDESTSRMFG